MKNLFDKFQSTKLTGAREFIAVLLISLFLCWLLSLAYPQGFVHWETTTYWGMQDHFSWLTPNRNDWMRTIPYGVILALCSKFANPTGANFWLNSAIFSLNMALIFVLGRLLFASTRAGLVLALTTLVFEFVSMRSFFMHLHAAADAFYGEIVFLGVLLALIAWLSCRSYLFVIAYAILGLAAFTRAIGVSYWPVWICFAAFAVWNRQTQRRMSYKVALLSIVLLLAPVLLWCGRNYYVYGRAKFNGEGGISLLLATLPLLSDNDKVLSDARDNVAFIASVRECDRIASMKENLALTPPNIARSIRFERYFFYDTNPPGPLDYLTGLKNPTAQQRWGTCAQAKTMFDLDAKCAQIAWNIIKAHPLGYLQRVVEVYIQAFSPLTVWVDTWESFQSDPVVAFSRCPGGTVWQDYILYPGTGKPNLLLGNRRVAKLISAICQNPIAESLLNCYYANELWLSHLIVFWAIFAYANAKFRRVDSAYLTNILRGTVVIVMLFLTAASQYLAIALCHCARWRYVVPSGEEELHLVFVIALVICIRKRSVFIDAFTSGVNPSSKAGASVFHPRAGPRTLRS